MSKESKRDYKLIRQVDVGAWRTGWIAKDGEENLRLLVSVNRENFEEKGLSSQYQALVEDRMWAATPAELDKKYEEESKSFVRRMEKLVGLEHANISKLYDIERDERGHPTAVIEYWFGEPIATALWMSSIPLFVAHFKQVFEAVAFIHKMGLFVLNWKPRFILSDLMSGETKFTGIWGIHTRDDINERRLAINPMYAAPEVIMRGDIDERADLYSVAVIMAEIWNGRPVFWKSRDSHSVWHIQQDIKNEREPGVMLDWRDRAVPDELGQNFVMRLLKKDPNARGFENAREVINYIVDTWPETCGPAKDLYGKVMTTTRL